jgi:hypothetical protein
VTYTVHPVAGTGNAHIFFTVKAARDGTVYVCYSNDHDVFIRYSRDKGTTWSSAIRVSDGPETKTAVFPWMETGPTPGTIGVVWYGTTGATNDNPDNWYAFYAGHERHFVERHLPAGGRQRPIHGANISESGLVIGGQSPNHQPRRLLPGLLRSDGAAIAFCDDHNDFSGHSYVTRQISGPGVQGTAIPAQSKAAPCRPAQFSTDGSQVVDFRRDAATAHRVGGLVVPPSTTRRTSSSTRRSSAPRSRGEDDRLRHGAHSQSNWRINFTANAPFSR